MIDQGQLPQETILNTYVYIHKNKRDKMAQYEIKCQGESYLNTKWVTPNNVSKEALTKYEANAAQNEPQHKNHPAQSVSSKQVRKPYYPKGSLVNSTVRSYPNPTFKIQINSQHQKPYNHFIYKDRVIKILKEVYRFRERNLVTSQSVKKEIQLELRQEYLRKQYQSKLAQEVYPTLKEIKAMKQKAQFNSNQYKLTSTVDVQVLWHDYTTSFLKIQQINLYSPSISHQYEQLRYKIKRKCCSLIKKTNRISLQIPTQIEQTQQIRNKIQMAKDTKSQQENRQIQIEIKRKMSLKFNIRQEQGKVKKFMQFQKKLKEKCEITRQSKLQSFFQKKDGTKEDKILMFQQQTSQQKARTIQID